MPVGEQVLGAPPPHRDMVVCMHLPDTLEYSRRRDTVLRCALTEGEGTWERVRRGGHAGEGAQGRVCRGEHAGEGMQGMLPHDSEVL